MMKTFFTLMLSLMLTISAFAQDLGSATKLYNEAATALNDGNSAEALTLFENALAEAEAVGAEADEIAENCKGIICNLNFTTAKEFASNKDYTNAYTALNKTIKLAEEYGQYDLAENVIDFTSKLYMSEGNAFLQKGKFEEAITKYQSSLDIVPNNAMIYLRMGMAYTRLNDETKAVETLTKAAELGQKANANKELAKFYLKQALTNLKAKKFDLAYEAGQKSLAVTQTPQALNICGKAALANKKYAQAIESYEAYLAATPNAKDANQTMYYLATAYEANGDKAKACGYYKQIMNDPQFKEFATHKVKIELKCN